MDEMWALFETLELKEDVHKAGCVLREWIAQSEQMAAAYLSRKSTRIPNSEQMNKLAQQVDRELDKGKTQSHRKALLHFIELGNQSGAFNLPLPDRVFKLRPEPSPFRPHKVPGIERARRWRSELLLALESGVRFDDDATVGAVLISAALNGGLVNGPSLQSLVQKMAEPLVCLNGRAYLDLSLRWRGADNAEQRRWFPDPVSEILFLRLPKHVLESSESLMARGGAPANQIWSPIRAAFRAILPNREEAPRNLTQFLSEAGSLNNTRLPLNIAAYQARSTIAHSLRPQVWERLNGATLAQPIPQRGRDAYIDPQEDEAHLETGLWAAPLWEALKGSEKQSVGQALRRIVSRGATPDAIELLLVQWASYMCANKSAAGNMLTMSTIRGYLVQTGKRLAGLLASDSPAVLSDWELGTLYEEVLAEAKSQNLKQKLRKGLREFHHFLCQRYGANPLVGNEVLGAAGALHPVDANLISLDEYYAIREWIRHADLDLRHPDLPAVAELVFVLGFRLGLRRMEVIQLRLQDYHARGQPELLIRPHGSFRLKTPNSRRKSPIYALLEQDEIQLLNDWVALRREQERKRPFSAALFSLCGSASEYLSSESVMPHIHNAMRAVTGDQSLRYHHLRHSFASWTFLRLMVAKHGKAEILFPQQPRTEAFLGESGELVHALYGPAGRWRADLYAIAALLGHSGPDMSLEHYIHTLDLVALACDPRRHDMLSTVLAIAEVPASSSYRQIKNGGIYGLLERVRAKHLSRVVYPRQRAVSAGGVEEAEPPLSGIIANAQKYLQLRQILDADTAVLAERVGWSESRCLALEEQARKLRGVQEHRFRVDRSASGDGGSPSRQLIPNSPRVAASKQLVEQLAPRLWDAIQADPQGTLEVLFYVSQNMWQTRAQLVFRDPRKPAMAQRYMRFLSTLGFNRSQLDFISYDERKRSPERQLWRKALGLTGSDTIACRPTPNRSSPATAGWLVIQPRFENDANTKAEGERSGFRYLLMMTVVVWPILMLENSMPPSEIP